MATTQAKKLAKQQKVDIMTVVRSSLLMKSNVSPLVSPIPAVPTLAPKLLVMLTLIPGSSVVPFTIM